MRKRPFFSPNPDDFVEDGVQKKEAQGLLSFASAACGQNRHQIVWGLGFRLLHYHLAFVVQLAFVPVGAVEEVRLASGWACSYLWCCQCVM